MNSNNVSSKTQKQSVKETERQRKRKWKRKRKISFFKEVYSQVWTRQYPVEYSSRNLLISPVLFLYATVFYLVVFCENSTCFSLHKLSLHLLNSRNPCLGTYKLLPKGLTSFVPYFPKSLTFIA